MLSMKAFPMRAHRCFTISTLLKTHSRHSSNIGVSSLPRFYSSQDKTSDSSTEGSSNPAPNTTSTTTTPSTEENVKIATNSKQIRRNEYVNQVDSLLQAHQVNQAVELFLANVDEYRPPPRLYDELINDCLDSHKAEKAYQIYRKQSERNFKIPSSTIEGLILQCDQMSARSKKLKNLRKTMAVIGLKPNAQLYNAMIRCYIGDDQWKVGLSLADAAVSSGFAFDDETMNYLLAAYGRVGNDGFYQALEMWHEMQRKQSRVTTFGMNGLLRSIRHCEHFDMTKMLETLERITATTAIENGNSQGNGGILGENEIFEEKLSKNENSEENSIEMKNSEENSIEIENSEETPKKSEIVAPVNTTNGDQNPIKDDGRPDLLADPRKIGRLFPLGSVSKPEHILLVLGGFSGILREMKLKSIVPNEETILTLLAIAPNSTPVEEKIHNLMKQHKVDSNEEQFLEVLLQRRCMRQDFKATLVGSFYLLSYIFAVFFKGKQILNVFFNFFLDPF